MSFTTLQLRRDTAADWASDNPVLSEGEFGLQIDGSGNIEGLKVGNGTDDWTTLPFRLGTNSTGQEFISDSTTGQAIVANTDTQVTIDALGAGTNRAQLPADISAIWDESTNRIRGIENDGRPIEFLFNFVPDDGVASNLDIWVDIGGVFTELFPESKLIANGQGQDHKSVYLFDCFNGATWETNGGRIMVRSDGPGVLSSKQLLTTIQHRARL